MVGIRHGTAQLLLVAGTLLLQLTMRMVGVGMALQPLGTVGTLRPLRTPQEVRVAMVIRPPTVTATAA